MVKVSDRFDALVRFKGEKSGSGRVSSVIIDIATEIKDTFYFRDQFSLLATTFASINSKLATS